MTQKPSWSQPLARLSWRLLSVPIFVKILGIGVLVGTVFSGMTLYYTSRTLSSSLYQLLEQHTRASAACLALALEKPLAEGDLPAVKREIDRARETNPDVRYILVRDARSKIVAHTFTHGVPEDLQAPPASTVPPQGDLHTLGSAEGLILEDRQPVLNGAAGLLQFGAGDRRIADEIAALQRSVLLALAISIILSAGLGLLLTHLLMQPIHYLAQTADRIGRGDFEARSEVFFADEVGRLALNFNRMAESLSAYRRAVEEKEQARVALLDRIVQTQEEERKKISRELHDQLGQSLAAILLTLQSNGALAQLPAQVKEDLIARIRGVSDEVRRLAWDMRPSILDDYGLDHALSRYLQEISKPSGLEIDYQYTGTPEVGRLPGRIEVTLYRLVQEALTNVMKHAHAKRVSIVVLRQSREVTLLVEDDGQGFDPARAPAGRGLGLTGMRERASLVGGEYMIESRPGEGTTVRVRIPLGREEPCPSVS
jgi:signal transduction histidine kinase